MNRKGTPANLAPRWVKGQSGNPAGRPKKRPITDEYFDLADKPLPEKLRKKLERDFGIKLPPGITWSQTAALRRFMEACGIKIEKGGTRAAKEIRESIEGKAPERLEITGPERKEITILVKYDRTK
jgi:Family of unknown function (DUF5681)